MKKMMVAMHLRERADASVGSMRRRFVGVLMALAMMGGVTASAAPAEARTSSWNNCAHGRACLFDNEDGTGRVVGFTTVGCHNVPVSFNDRAGAVWNRSIRTMTLYKHSGCRNLLAEFRRRGVPHPLHHALQEVSSVRLS